MTSLFRLRIPENHSDYPPIPMVLLEIIPIFRQSDVTKMPASKKFIPKHASTTCQTWQAARLAEKKLSSSCRKSTRIDGLIHPE